MRILWAAVEGAEGYSGEGVDCGGYSGFVEGEGVEGYSGEGVDYEGTQGMWRVRGWRAIV